MGTNAPPLDLYMKFGSANPKNKTGEWTIANGKQDPKPLKGTYSLSVDDVSTIQKLPEGVFPVDLRGEKLAIVTGDKTSQPAKAVFELKDGILRLSYPDTVKTFKNGQANRPMGFNPGDDVIILELKLEQANE